MNAGAACATLAPGSTVAVAMSGGVDSSVAAALCVEAGFRVVGIMLRLWAEPGAATANKCCTAAAVDDARSVADALDIPFHVLDAERVFKRRIVDAFVAAAARGDTPNPCFTCNRGIRFGYLLDQARALGADALATGHYARVERLHDGTYALARGVDRAKDQSYVLYRLGQAELARACFPVGTLDKPAVRALAAAHGLPVAARPDSVDLCWTGPDGVAGFLARTLGAEAMAPGPIVDRDGRVLGRHAGLPRYTLGQRRGLGVAAAEPLYVVDRDAASDTLVVGPDRALWHTTAHATDMHWIAGAPPAAPLGVTAQIRYRAEAAPAELWLDASGDATVRFAAPQRAPTPGQGIVLYAGDVVLGGGRITGASGG